MTDRQHEPWMVTASSGRFYPMSPKPEDFKIEDIAHGLARECRYGNQIPPYNSKREPMEIYSVAQHSICMSYLVPPRLALPALMHDAAEAYLRDIPHPIKVCLPQYKEMEDATQDAINVRFGSGASDEDYREIKYFDVAIRGIEARYLGFDTTDWNLPPYRLDGIAPFTLNLIRSRMSIREAQLRFEARFEELTEDEA